MEQIENIEEILKNTFKTDGWIIKKSIHGLSKESFVAQNNQRTVFIKFDVNIPPLKRVSDMGLAPSLISSGTYKNRTFIIQEYIKGIYPTNEWLNNNLPMLAKFINTYHSDKKLFNILNNDVELDYRKNIEDSIRFVEKQLSSVKELIVNNETEKEIKRFIKKSKELQPVELTPIHTDPNYKNILVVKNKLYMLDWDDVRISDPIRDVTPLLWWYVDKNKWPLFFESLNMKMDSALLDRFYWWMARQSLTIAIFFAKRKDSNQVKNYLTDFLAALNRKDNPRAKKKLY